MTDTLNLYRIDPKNIGDMASPPFLYHPLGQRVGEVLNSDPVPDDVSLCVVGGGGLGRDGAFAKALKVLAQKDRHYRLIAWGVGADTISDKKGRLEGPADMERLLTFFEGFDLVGTRVYQEHGYEDPRYSWVPCASCLSPKFDHFRDAPPTRPVGIYNHLRVDLRRHIRAGQGLWARLTDRTPVQSNRGSDLAEKLAFLASCETIVTNTYHGVYWATLLNRKVVCVPFKNGLFSFKHAPTYLDSTGLEAALDAARTYPDALDECRKANHVFARKVLGDAAVTD
ncbi:MAG: polysaccharide pyruvyl transferase family protein [Pseudomonadota bacterium]